MKKTQSQKLTKQKLLNFIKTRNASECNSNLQFEVDATNCGFEIKDLGKPEKFPIDNIFCGYKWITPFGTLIEGNGKLRLEQ